MRKLILSVALAATVAGAATFAWQSNAQEPLSDVELENIEALTRDETIVDVIPCHSSAIRNYDASYTACSSCSTVYNWEGSGQESKCTVKR